MEEQFGRPPKTKAEKEFAEATYQIGMKNGWCSGRYAIADGDFIVEEDRLNRNSFAVIEDIEQLRRFFQHSNWCLGQGIIFKDLCFIEQVNGGSEFLVIKNGKEGCFDFDSWSTEAMVKDNTFINNVKRVLKATDEQLKNLEY